jgi:hypothetical protein
VSGRCISGRMRWGFTSTATGAAGSYDRMIYMANNGQIYFGAGANKTIDSTLPTTTADGT